MGYWSWFCSLLWSPLWDVVQGVRVYAVAHPIFSGTMGVLAATTILLWLCLRRPPKRPTTLPSSTRTEEEEEEEVEAPVPTPTGRIRKRDIVRYYGRRMIRKAHVELRHLRRRPREKVYNIARRLLQRPEEPERQLYTEPPAAFLEADYLQGDTNVPSEVLYLLKSVRVFGHFEKPLFMELCKHVETKFVPAGAILFRHGQMDDSIYVVRNGRLKVFILEPDGSELPLKEAGTGDSVHSMLSILDAITGHPRPFKTVAARAIRDSYVLQVKAAAFIKFFEDNPDSLLRMVQIIMVRLQRVTFLALNQFLGLGHELCNQTPQLPGELSVTRIKKSVRLTQSDPQTFVGKPLYGRQPLSDSDSDTDVPAHQKRPRKLSMGKTPSTASGHRAPVNEQDTTKQASSSCPLTPKAEDSREETPASLEHPEEAKTGAGLPDSDSNQPLSDNSSTQLTSSGSIPNSPSRTPRLSKKKPHSVAIDTSQNECFTHRLLPVQSSEFDNVINQARVDRQEFSAEGSGLDIPSPTSSILPPSLSPSSTVPADSSSTHPLPSSGTTSSAFVPSVPLKFSHFASLESSEVLQAAVDDLVTILQIEDESVLNGRIQLIEVAANSLLGLEGDLESCVYFIATGRVKVFRQTGEDIKSQDLLYVACPGEFCSVLSALTGEPSFITVMAAVDSHLVAITKTNLYHIMSENPRAVCGLAFDLVQRLSPIVRQIDFALDWMELEAGRALYRQGDEAGASYIILNGRVRSVVKKADGKRELVDEFGRGEAIGVVEVMTNSTCATTVHAIRDTELACLPSGLLNTIKLKQPQVVSRLIQLLGEKILGSYSRATTISSSSLEQSISSGDMKKHMASNLATVAVVPVTPDVPLSLFTRELCSFLNTIAPALRLTSALIQRELGSAALESIHEYRLRTWLGHQEDTHRIVLYQAEATLTPWTARCIRQADCILLVGLAEKGPLESMGQIVKQVETISMRVQKELVLLHREEVTHPQGTVKWLNALGWLSSYFHVRCPEYFFTRQLKDQDEESLPPPPSKHSDFARLARRLTGTSVGLVLGGGGARGLSHVGAIKAFCEAGIPIDMVGGTSIGSLIGALYCEDRDAGKVETRARDFSKGMSSLWDKVLDLTYPSTSMFTGRAFNRLLCQTFGEKQIEDLWIPYFCVTTDITESKMRVHSSGSLWRYVRSSMSLSGYLPPLCDPVDGHLLLDGGYVNNLPADIVAAQGAETIIAVDVGSADNNDLSNYGDHISGWYLLWNKINPFARKIRVPTLTEIQSRLAYVSCIRQLEAVKQDGACEYVRPPIDNITTLQFGKFDHVMKLGYHHCKTVVSGWQKDLRMKNIFSGTNEEERERKRKQHLLEKFEDMARHRSSSVRDLVALASQIPRHRLQSTEDVDGAVGYWSSPEDVQVLLKTEDEGEESPCSDSPSPTSEAEKQVKFVTVSDSELT